MDSSDRGPVPWLRLSRTECPNEEMRHLILLYHRLVNGKESDKYGEEHVPSLVRSIKCRILQAGPECFNSNLLKFASKLLETEQWHSIIEHNACEETKRVRKAIEEAEKTRALGTPCLDLESTLINELVRQFRYEDAIGRLIAHRKAIRISAAVNAETDRFVNPQVLKSSSDLGLRENLLFRLIRGDQPLIQMNVFKHRTPGRAAYDLEPNIGWGTEVPQIYLNALLCGYRLLGQLTDSVAHISIMIQTLQAFDEAFKLADRNFTTLTHRLSFAVASYSNIDIFIIIFFTAFMSLSRQAFVMLLEGSNTTQSQLRQTQLLYVMNIAMGSVTQSQRFVTAYGICDFKTAIEELRSMVSFWSLVANRIPEEAFPTLLTGMLQKITTETVAASNEIRITQPFVESLIGQGHIQMRPVMEPLSDWYDAELEEDGEVSYVVKTGEGHLGNPLKRMADHEILGTELNLLMTTIRNSMISAQRQNRP